MGIKRHRPTSAGRRFRTDLTKEEITKDKPEKALTSPLRRKSGRSHGKIAVRRRGGGHKRKYRMIDFRRYDKAGVEAEVLAIEYDPNRSGNIALVQYADGEKRDILAPVGLKVGDRVVADETVKIQVGNAAPLKSFPLGTGVHNVELTPGKGGELARSAGNVAVLRAKEKGLVQLRLPSGEVRLVPEGNWATIGQIGNVDHHLVVLGKAGRSRHLGRRPKVRGTAMPAGEHPHGGGEARTGTGRIPRTYAGRKFKGVKTRKRNKRSNKYIVRTKGR